jgi:acetylornithine deacetylase/succinyl-diaminopimelate desuccinylase-like protein
LAHWTVQPFAGEIRDGYVYGRGAIDDKGALAANLELFLLLHRLKISLARDVIFLAEASEELSSEAGMKMLVEKHWDKIACEYAINEGSVPLVENGKIKYFAINTTEKLPRKLTLIATGTSGHGSIPRTDNAIVHLAAAVAKAGTWSTPSRLNDTTREFFAQLATVSSPDESAWYRDVLKPAVQETLRTKKPMYYSMLRTSISPTMLKAGIKKNVIPPTAEAVLDVRLLPGDDLHEIGKLLEREIDDPQLSISYEDDEALFSMPTGAPSDINNEMFTAFRSVQKRLFPESITLPMMSTGGTDSAFLRTKGVQAYGIGIPRAENDIRQHANDERVEIKQISNYLRFVYNAVVEVSATGPVLASLR